MLSSLVCDNTYVNKIPFSLVLNSDNLTSSVSTLTSITVPVLHFSPSHALFVEDIFCLYINCIIIVTNSVIYCHSTPLTALSTGCLAVKLVDVEHTVQYVKIPGTVD
jgi:hypothetical protein